MRLQDYEYNFQQNGTTFIIGYTMLQSRKLYYCAIRLGIRRLFATTVEISSRPITIRDFSRAHTTFGGPQHIDSRVGYS